MLTSESVNLQPRPNLVYVEGGVNALRLAPDQAKSLGLREGQVINGVVANRPDGSVLTLGAKSLALPPGFASGQSAVSLLVSVVGGQIVLSLIDRQQQAQAKQRVPAGATQRFHRLLGQVGSFHLLKLLEPNNLSRLFTQFAGPEEGQSFHQLLLSSNSLSAGQIRRTIEGTGIFLETQLKAGAKLQGVSLKSMLLMLQKLMRGRQLDVSSISGAIEELEARQLESLSSQLSSRGMSLSWVLPFMDQMPVFLNLGRKFKDDSGKGDIDEDSVWYVDLDIPIRENTRCAVNIELSNATSLRITAWIPHEGLFRGAVQYKDDLSKLLSGAGLLAELIQFYPTPRAPKEHPVSSGFKGLQVSV